MEEEKKKSRIGKIIVGILIGIIICGGIIFGLYKMDKINFGNTNNREEQADKDYSEKSDDYKYELHVYSDADGYQFKKNNNNEELFTIKAKTENAKGLTSKSNFILYDDGGLKVYNVDTRESTDLDLKNEYDEYKLNVSNSGDGVIGILMERYRNDRSEEEYINLVENKKMYMTYEGDLNVLNEEYLVGYRYEELDYTYVDILSPNIEKKFKTIELEGCSSITELPEVKGIYIVSGGCYVGSKPIAFLNKDFEFFTDYLEDNEFFVSDNKLNVLNKRNQLETYDKNGDMINTLNLKGEVLHVFEDYYLTIENNKIIIRDYKDYNKELGEWNNYYYDYVLSGYEDNEFNHKDTGAGYYFTFKNRNANDGIEIYFNSLTKEVKSRYVDAFDGHD